MENINTGPLIEIEYVEKEHYVYLRTTGDYTTKDVDDFLKKATEFAKKFNCFRILLDHRNCKFTAEIIDIHRITKYLKKYGFNIKYKGAVVYNQDHEKYAFADTVAHNWSMGVLRFFDDFETAKKWLRE